MGEDYRVKNRGRAIKWGETQTEEKEVNREGDKRKKRGK